MEVNLSILDTFPSLNKLSLKNNLLLEYNNKEYNLKSIINQQDIFSIKENASEISFKIYALSNNNKVLIGTNQLNIDSLNSENKSSIVWLEFKKKEENKKEINDINLLFYDCIRLKIKVTKIKTIPKTDKKIKTNKSKIKFVSPHQQMKKNKKKYNIKENNNLVNSCRIVNTNNCLLKSNSLKDNIKTIVDNNAKNEDNDKKDTSKDNESNHIMEKYQELKIDPKKSISYEYMKELKIENDALLTDYNILDNYESITLHGDNCKNVTYTKNRSNANCDDILQKSLSPSNFNNMIKNILLQSNEEEDKNIHLKRDCSFNKDINTIKEDESFNNSNANTNSNTNTNRIQKLKAHHKKTKSLNKIYYNCNNNDTKKRNNNNSKEISNLKNKNKKNGNINKSLSKENLLHGYYTLNDFYNKKLKNNPINEKDKNININAIEEKEIILKERKMTSDDKNICLNGVLISKIKDTEHQNNLEEFEVTKNDINEEGPINFEQFYSMKKDYELFYTLKFIENIKNDLLDLEFNLALDKSISLFMLYNKEVNSFYKSKKELVNVILNYTHKIEEIHKKLDLLNHKKRKNITKEKNKLLIHDVTLNLNKEILSQKKIMENLVTNKINKKETLKSIIAILIKRQPLLLELLNKNFKNEEKGKEKENGMEKEKEKEIKNKLQSKSPTKSITKTKIKLQRVNDGLSKKKEPNLSENKIRSKSKNTFKKSQVEINAHKLKKNNKKKILKKNKSVKKNLIVTSNEIKNLIKNSSINNLLSLDNITNRNSLCTENLYNKECKSGDINNIHSLNNEIVNGKNNNSNSIYYSTVRNKFYSFNPGKLNK